MQISRKTLRFVIVTRSSSQSVSGENDMKCS